MNSEEQRYRTDLDKYIWSETAPLRTNTNFGDHMHVVLGWMFLNYVFNAFKDKMARLAATPVQGFSESVQLDFKICKSLVELDYAI